ncbi:MAG TPA: DNA repair protein RecO [Burkholderiaceae bacterium]|nr:DNA repair protein RecO [Burkholderiaceae bacterium]
MAEAERSGTKPHRRVSDARVDHQPGIVLHATPWRETSLIVEVFTRDYGRTPLIARGAKRPTSQFRGLLAPFAPLALSWSGRGEIKNLVRVEWVGGMPPLRGQALLSAFYANELLVRLLARADPHERLFEHYLEMLRGLARARHDATLRVFELELLREVGYAVPLDQCSSGEAIDAESRYSFRPEAGAQRLAADEGDPVESAVSGETLLAMSRGDFSNARVAAEAKRMLRQLIRYHLDGKPLNTRRILLDLHEL